MIFQKLRISSSGLGLYIPIPDFVVTRTSKERLEKDAQRARRRNDDVGDFCSLSLCSEWVFPDRRRAVQDTWVV